MSKFNRHKSDMNWDKKKKGFIQLGKYNKFAGTEHTVKAKIHAQRGGKKKR